MLIFANRGEDVVKQKPNIGYQTSIFLRELAGDFEEISFIFMFFFVFFRLFCHLSEENVQIVTLFEN